MRTHSDQTEQILYAFSHFLRKSVAKTDRWIKRRTYSVVFTTLFRKSVVKQIPL